MIDTVTFDVWETIIRDNAVRGEARGALRVKRMTEVLQRAGHRVSEGAMRAAYDRSWPSYEPIWQTGREVTAREQVQMLLTDLDGNLGDAVDAPTRAALEDAYVGPIFDEPPLLNVGVPDVLCTLRLRRVRVGLICNTGRTPGYAMRRLLGDYGVLGYFEALAFSDEEGIRKPNPAIFRRVLGALGGAPETAAHVGDDLVADISGAKSAGMRAILLRSRCPKDAAVTPDAHITSLGQLIEAIGKL